MKHGLAKILILALLFFGVVSSSFAAAPEICGDGIDDSLQTGGAASGTKGSCPVNYHDALIGNGCDADCTGDKDHDGYTTTDCDDTRADVYPNVYTPNSYTSPTGYKLCQTNGTFGATILTATTPFCNATGTGVCRYVDCANSLGAASDANNGLTYGAPKLTHTAAAAQMLAGDSLLFIGSGTCNEAVSYNTVGTAGNGVVKVGNYPGSTAKLNSSGTTISVPFARPFYRFDNLDIDATNNGILINSDDVEVSRTYIHDIAGNGDNNNACLKGEGTNRTNFHHSFFKDCLRATGNVQNLAGITWLDTTPNGADHYGAYNTVWYTAYNLANSGHCFVIKHGVTAAGAGASGHRVLSNTCVNSSYTGLTSGTSKLRAFYNRFFSGAINGKVFVVGNIGGSIVNNDIQFRYNTVIQGGGGFGWNPFYTPPESVAFDHNIVVGTSSSYVAGDNEGIISIGGYGSDAHLATFEANNYLTSDYNCFYSPNATAVFSYFASPLGAGGHGPAGNAGANYSFANWQAVKGHDLNSYLQVTGIATPKYEGTGNCATFGYNQAPALDDPTPTPTPTPGTSAGYLPYLQ